MSAFKKGHDSQLSDIGATNNLMLSDMSNYNHRSLIKPKTDSSKAHSPEEQTVTHRPKRFDKKQSLQKNDIYFPNHMLYEIKPIEKIQTKFNLFRK